MKYFFLNDVIQEINTAPPPKQIPILTLFGVTTLPSHHVQAVEASCKMHLAMLSPSCIVTLPLLCAPAG